MLDEATCTTVVDVEDLILAAPEAMGAAAALGARTVAEADYAAEAHLRPSASESTLPIVLRKAVLMQCIYEKPGTHGRRN